MKRRSKNRVDSWVNTSNDDNDHSTDIGQDSKEKGREMGGVSIKAIKNEL